MKLRSRSSRATGPKMREPRGIVLRGDQHGGVLVEADVAPVRALVLLGGAHHDGADHIALLHLGVRLRRPSRCR